MAQTDSASSKEKLSVQAPAQGNMLLIGSIIGGILLLSFIALAAFYITNSSQNQNTNQQNSATTSPIQTQSAEQTTPSATQSLNSSQGSVFENDFMKLTVPSGWNYISTQSGAVSLLKGNYILYINPNFQQASGIKGGRFSEISMGAPSADAVITVQPSGQCGTSESHIITTSLSRVDLFVDNTEKAEYCATPTNGKTVWYFSYVSNGSGYINYYTSKPDKGYVITMAYNSKTVNNLPVKGDNNLESMLGEMTDIVKSLQLKQK